MARRTTPRTPAQERAAGVRWANQLPMYQVHQLVDDMVVGIFDWRDWGFETRPSAAFLDGAFNTAQDREEMRGGHAGLGAGPTLFAPLPTRALEDELMRTWGLSHEAARRMVVRDIATAKAIWRASGSIPSAAEAIVYKRAPHLVRHRQRHAMRG